MKILFSTGTLFRLPLEEVFLLAKKAGFDGCDLVVNHRLDNPHYLETVRELVTILPAYSLHAPFTRLKVWGNQVDALNRSIEMAKELGIRLVNFHPPSWFHLELGFFRWFRRIRDFQKELSCENILLAIENMPRIGRHLKLAPYILNDFRDLIEFGVNRNLNFTFDTTHAATFDQDAISTFFGFFKTERLKNIHLSDYDNYESHLFPGRGKLPIVRLLNTARSLGYDGMVTLEISPLELPVNEEWLLKVMQYASSYMKLHLGRDTDA